MTEPDLAEFLDRHKLPGSYIELARRWFFPLAEEIATPLDQHDRPLILGINGSQGSGKSTLGDLLQFLFNRHYRLRTVVLSIDDFYYTREQRKQLAETIHPLMATRGVPGTHDVNLILDVIRDLQNPATTTAIPRFDKAADDRAPEEFWDAVEGSPDIILFEGWCIGARPQDESELVEAVNALEAGEDTDGTWRRYVNSILAGKYQQLFALIDTWIMLKAPSFDCVYKWRLEQEQKLRHSRENNDGEDASASRVMTDDEIARFIQYYQRITENLLQTLPSRVDYLYELDEQRNIIAMRTPGR